MPQLTPFKFAPIRLFNAPDDARNTRRVLRVRRVHQGLSKRRTRTHSSAPARSMPKRRHDDESDAEEDEAVATPDESEDEKPLKPKRKARPKVRI